MRYIKKRLKATLQAIGFDLVRYRPDHILVPQHLCPSAHKLFDFRAEPGFAEIARDIIGHGRTTLDYNRLFVLWQAVKNTYQLGQAVAEVGTYKGGSARFIAASFGYWDRVPTIHVFDTFKGHPDIVVPSLDGSHIKGLFSDTSYAAVKDYLALSGNVKIHVGAFQETCASVTGVTFCLVHIDVDIYQSTVDCLEFFWPRLCDGGLIVVDDYGFVTCQGVKRAVDEFASSVSSCQTWYMHTGQLIIQRRDLNGA